MTAAVDHGLLTGRGDAATHQDKIRDAAPPWCKRRRLLESDEEKRYIKIHKVEKKGCQREQYNAVIDDCRTQCKEIGHD